MICRQFDYKRIEAIKKARLAAEAAVANPQTDQKAAKRGVSAQWHWLDHEAAGLIANAALTKTAAIFRLQETGREAIAVRTIDIIPATRAVETTEPF